MSKKKAEILANYYRRSGETEIKTTTYAVGSGEWSIEVREPDNTFLFELVGSNGNSHDCPEADNLWKDLYAIEKKALELANIKFGKTIIK